MNKLLENAVTSISIGVEDFHSKDPRRMQSSIRNIYAGILLMFKSKLLDLSPTDSNEVLIKVRIKPVLDNGQLKFVGDGKTTVDVQEIHNRFDGLGINVDWKVFEKIQRERNNIEHYHTNIDQSALSSLIVEAMLVMRDFIQNVIREDASVLLGETWNQLLKIETVYLKEKAECDKSIDEFLKLEIDQLRFIKRIHCDKCGSDLISAETTFSEISKVELICKKCANDFKLEKIFEEEFGRIYGAGDYGRVRDGLEPDVKICPECGKDTFSEETGTCLFCSYEREYEECEICGSELSAEEQELGGMCSYCSYKFDKLQNED